MSFTKSDLVLITGANGHVGSHLVDYLLKDPNGPQVRAAVRTEKSAAPLQATFKQFVDSGRLKFSYVADMTAPGAYDSAVKGATHIAHVASPLILDPPDLEKDLLRPAIQGTVGLLESANKSNDAKSVVVTSSFAAAFDPFKGWSSDYTYSSQDWNPITYEQGAGREATKGLDERYQGFMAYLSSKKLAEEAAWNYYHKHVEGGKGKGWKFSTILPTYIGGPCVLPLKGEVGLDGYSFSQAKITDIAQRGTNKGLVDDFPFWVDVRDVAKAHAQALLRQEAHGKRWILACQKARMWQIAKSIQVQSPWREVEVFEENDRSFDIACDESLQGLGLGEWIGLDEMVRDTVGPVVGNL
ncbi:hypothetical protein M409DRAFT_19966 [Zasmidium cellare ATCC 36951]|uniref:NAD-dependent epimerase/dehydratase domain-containing protein n=1 Tax=Zasmidium cellare ATCC 36951 TaxID=1080233 RepID=A0A6A6CQW1_ZASCE|nr:uncharacterized protein M409DRAFT_19966 [Zasmidium cellare ATCC 36951]KAF2169554.1 hypothetical protein M409DRAFT_19966 [Zasmidium cellare ATCC 36951]